MSAIPLEQITHTIQFHHPEKMLVQKMLGINEANLAALLGIRVGLYRRLRNGFQRSARRAAQNLLADPAFAVLVDRLPFAPQSTVVGLGDSLTDDCQSWLEILRQLLLLRRPADQIQVINAGISGDTTTHLISRFHYVSQQAPNWIICLVGTNDVRRHGQPPNQVLVSAAETTRNLQVLRHLATTQTRSQWVWMTPPPVIERAISAELASPMIPPQWWNIDLQQVAAIIRQQTEPVIDLQDVFGWPADPRFLLADGLHPSLVGQQAIAQAVVENLAVLF
jgi:acyl-CoA thioesterase I